MNDVEYLKAYISYFKIDIQFDALFATNDIIVCTKSSYLLPRFGKQ